MSLLLLFTASGAPTPVAGVVPLLEVTTTVATSVTGG